MNTYLYPDPKAITGLVSLEKAIVTVQRQPRDRLTTLIQGYADVRGIGGDIEWLRSFEAVPFISRPSQRIPHKFLFLCAAHRGDLDIFVLDPLKKIAFQIRKSAWDSGKQPFFSDESLWRCQFRVNVTWLTEGSLDSLLINYPLFVNQKQIEQWLKLRPPAELAMMKSGAAIIDKHRSEWVDSALTKSEFRKTLLLAHPTATGRRIDKVWEMLAPPEWKKPGQKRRAQKLAE